MAKAKCPSENLLIVELHSSSLFALMMKRSRSITTELAWVSRRSSSLVVTLFWAYVASLLPNLKHQDAHHGGDHFPGRLELLVALWCLKHTFTLNIAVLRTVWVKLYLRIGCGYTGYCIARNCRIKFHESVQNLLQLKVCDFVQISLIQCSEKILWI